MKHQWKPLLLLAYVFVFVGAIICMNDILLPSLKQVFGLSYVQASFIQQSFYLVYLIFPIPLAFYISRYGYKTSVITALFICGAGASLFAPAFYFESYAMALMALFVISIGITLVNVAANPMAALLGDASGAHVRVNFVQLFSRIGYALTPVLATRLIYNGNSINFHVPYLVLSAGTILFAVIIIFSSLPSLKPDKPKGFTLPSIFREAQRYPQLYWGAAAMFFEMGMEACTAGFYISYLTEVRQFTSGETASYLTYYYIASSLMAIVGMYLLQVFSAGRLVAVFGSGLLLMFLLASLTTTHFNEWYLVGMGAFISILFPCVFSLAIEGLGNFTEKGSALVNMAVVGGALFPPLQGWLADEQGIQVSYLVPAGCVIVVIVYGLYCASRKISLQVSDKSPSPEL
jgi:FHS family L-fucose permease-like MFS transporter